MATAQTGLFAWRAAAFTALERQVRGNRFGSCLSRFIVALIIANGLAVVLETNASLYAAHREAFVLFEIFSVLVFTAEYLGRVWVAVENPQYHGLPPWRARLKYLVSPLALVDLLAIAPFYLSLLIPIDLRYLRLFRLLRLLKLTHYFDGLHVFLAVLRREAGSIAGALLTMVILIVLSACLMFTIEHSAQPGNFSSIAQSIWWAVVTLTTVGYGDITPVTFAGKLLGILIMLLGVCAMALPAGIMAARFTEELQSRREMMTGKVMEALQDGTLDAGELADIERLKKTLGLSAEELRRIVSLQQAKTTVQYRFCPHCGEGLERK